MTKLFSEKDFTDQAGYNLNAKYIVEIANERVAPLLSLLELVEKNLTNLEQLMRCQASQDPPVRDLVRLTLSMVTLLKEGKNPWTGEPLK